MSASTPSDRFQGSPDPSVLDNVVWAALQGPHERFALAHGQAARYRREVSLFVGVAPDCDERMWGDLASLHDPGEVVVPFGLDVAAPAEWEILGHVDAAQMVATDLRSDGDPEIVRLSERDVPEMLELVERTKPGPFLPRTIELGDYFGVRRDGALIAMAGERLHPPGWTEISAVCTDDDYRGQGLGSRLVRVVGAGIVARGETPFLHASATNTSAIRLYESLGFTIRRHMSFQVLRVPS